ncbi:MAG TPA: phosphopantetheine-binding protein, partial [Rhodothermales bacterium]|nr:phosphopantetheine-binding protein [Rhodothermales bacterium]
RGNRFSAQEVDTAVLEARKRYHREQDAVSACIDVSLLQSDEIFEKIQILDFYRYWDAPLEDIYDYLSHRLPWIRPSDTGRSTNCRVNDVGIYIHNKERGFHNYALPYSWDVRLGQKKRDEAVEELDDRYDLAEVRKMLAEIGYDENRLTENGQTDELVAYYVADREIDAASLARFIGQSLPAPMRPSHFIHLASMPLTPNGKIDTRALPPPASAADRHSNDFVAPQGPVEEHVSKLWSQMLSVSKVGSTDNFFRLGGTSLTAMEITLQLCEDFEIDLPLQSIFTHSTVAELSVEIERAILQQIESLSDEQAASLLAGPSRV